MDEVKKEVTDNANDANMADDTSLIHDLPIESNDADMTMKKSFLIFGLFIVAGIITGFVVSYVSSGIEGNKTTTTASKETGGKDVIESAGVADKEIFSDSAEGKLNEGGSENGEGSFNLERPGGESQTVYLTSSTVDLSEFVGKKVRVHGETFAGEQVGWLMDVGFIEVIK